MVRAKTKKKPASKKAAKAAVKRPVKVAKAKVTKAKVTKPTVAKAKAAKAKAATKSAARKPAKAKPARAAARAREAEVLEVEEIELDEDEDAGSLDEILEVLGCPPGTADQLCEVCEEGLEAIQRNLPHVAAAELVWNERPAHAELAAGITGLIEELQRHAQALSDLYDRLYPHAQDAAEHEDLDPAEVLDRITPLLEHHAKMEGAHDDAHHDHDHGEPPESDN